MWSSYFLHPLISLLGTSLAFLSPVSVLALEPGRRLKSESLNLIKYSTDIDFPESLDPPPPPLNFFPSLHPFFDSWSSN